MKRILAGTVMIIAAAGCAGGPAAPPYKPIADTKLLMEAVIDPQADHIWDSAGSIETMTELRELGPKTAEEWTSLRNSSVALAEAGNLLMMVPRARDEEWIRLAGALVDAGAEAIRAADSRDVGKVFEAGGTIYSVCQNCHTKYILEE
jgi:hypothetical protein